MSMPQSAYEGLLKDYMHERSIDAEHLVFKESCHSVEEAAMAANAKADDFIKSICMVDAQGRLIVAIVKGEDKASAVKIS